MGRLQLVPDRLSNVQGRKLATASTNPDSWRNGKTTAERGYDSKWQRARAAYLEKHPLCVACEKEGIYTLATDLDHIIPHRGDKALFWDRSNWQGLCHPCHSRKTQMESKGRYADTSRSDTREVLFVPTIVNVVIGPSCAGKSTFVREHSDEGDLVVDYDKIALALGSAVSHKSTGLVREAAFAARRAAIDMAFSGKGGTAWIIHTRPTLKQVARYRESGAAFHVVNPGLKECLLRADSDKRPIGTKQDIKDWFNKPIDEQSLKLGMTKLEALDILLGD